MDLSHVCVHSSVCVCVCLPRFVPVTYAATLPFLHVSGLRLLRRVLRSLAERTLAPLAAAWGAHFAQVTRRETATLSHALAPGSCRRHLACLGPGLLLALRLG